MAAAASPGPEPRGLAHRGVLFLDKVALPSAKARPHARVVARAAWACRGAYTLVEHPVWASAPPHVLVWARALAAFPMFRAALPALPVALAQSGGPCLVHPAAGTRPRPFPRDTTPMAREEAAP